MPSRGGKRRSAGVEESKTPVNETDLPVSFDAAVPYRGKPVDESTASFVVYWMLYLALAVVWSFGKLRDICGRITGHGRYFGAAGCRPEPGYAPLLKDWEDFYTRRMYHRIQFCWNRPIGSAPRAGATKVLTRTTKDNNKTRQLDGGEIDCINLSSYNYLGFADDWHTSCKERVMGVLGQYPASQCSSRLDAGNTPLHQELERKVAEFVGKPASICFNMGYMTNAATIPALIGKGGLIVSDALNHTSIVNGARGSGAVVRTFLHNDPQALGEMLEAAVVDGQPKTGRAWKKILVLVEGIYSMEGDICRLKEIVAVAKKYKAYVYLDEAHSIGCLGKTGRGVCEYTGTDPRDIDIMMGTFTKSFGAMGGYIAGSKELVSYLRTHASSAVYGTSMSGPVIQQALTALQVIMGEDGTDTGAKKLQAIRYNANYFRAKLLEMGLEVIGEFDSPVIPMICYAGPKMSEFSKICLRNKLAVVVVGFPATPLLTARARFCISAGHTKGQLDQALAVISDAADLLMLHYRHSTLGL